MGDYLTGNTRTAKRVTTITIEQRVAYGYYDAWTVGRSEVPSLIKPWYEIYTVEEAGPSGPIYRKYLHYGFSHAMSGVFVRVELGSFEVPIEASDPMAAGPWTVFHWTITATLTETWENLRQFLTDLDTFLTVGQVSPSNGLMRRELLVNNTHLFSTSGNFQNSLFGWNSYTTNYPITAHSTGYYAGRHSDFGMYDGTYGATGSYQAWQDDYANYAQGCAGSCEVVWDNADVLLDEAGADQSFASGSATPYSLSLFAAPDNTRYRAQLQTNRKAKQDVTVSGMITALGDPLDGGLVEVAIAYGHPAGPRLISTTGHFFEPITLGGGASLSGSYSSDKREGGLFLAGPAGTNGNFTASSPSSGTSVAVYLTDAAMAAQGGVTDKEVPIMGMKWAALSLAQAATYVIEGNPWIVGPDAWKSAAAAVSIVGSALHIEMGGTTGTVFRSYPAQPVSNVFGPFMPLAVLGYRRIRVRLRSVGSANDSFFMDLPGVRAGAKDAYFALSTGADGVWVERVSDVYFHSNAPQEKGMDTDSPDITGVSFRGIAAGRVIEIEYVRGEIIHESLSSALTSEWTRLTPNDLERKKAVVLENMTDGWRTLREWAFRVPQNTRTIAETAARINGLLAAGYTATDLKPPRVGKPTSGYLPLSDLTDGDRFLFSLQGGGITSQDAMALDRNTAAGATFEAQNHYYTVTPLPGCGDAVLNPGSPYGSTTPLVCRRLLRSQVVGVVLSDEDSVPTVQVFKTPGDVANGTATPRAVSRTFAAGPPMLRRSGTYRLTLDTAEDPPDLPFAVAEDKRRLYAYLPHSTGEYFPLTVFSERGLLHSGKDKKLRGHHLFNWSLQGESPDYAAVDKWLSLSVDPRGASLAALGKSGASLKVFLSTDGGMTATEVLTMTADSGALVALSELGPLVFLYSTGGTIWRKTLPKNTTIWTAAEQVTDQAGAALAGKVSSVTYDPRHGSAIYLGRKSGSVYTVWESTNGGKSFTQVLA